MIKRNKLTLILSSVVIMLPALIGPFLSNILPEKIVTHLGINGKPDGWSDPSTAFLVLPIILLAIHWLLILLSMKLDKNIEKHSGKMFKIVLWIIPAISIFSFSTIVALAIDSGSNVFAWVLIFLGLTFMIIGNYMPKTTRNITSGIKIKWTIGNDENWNATHRFAGRLYFIVGFLCLTCILLPAESFVYVMLVMILISTLLPTLYSYNFYKKQIKNGAATKEEYQKEYDEVFKHSKGATLITVISVAIVLIVVAFLMFTGDIEISVSDSQIKVEADFSEDLTLDFEDIDTVEYREAGISGTRIYGFASARLLLGTFQNDELGRYTSYVYTGKNPCIILTSGNDIYVIGNNDPENLKEIFEAITSKTGEKNIE